MTPMEDFELAKALFYEGLACFEQENFAQAEIKFRDCLKLVPDRISTLTNLSATLIRLKKTEAAREFSLRSIALDPASAESWVNLGLVEKESSNQTEAIHCFEKAIEIAPNYAEAWTNKGIALQELERYDEALACHDRAIRIKPDYAEAYSNRGSTLRELERLEESLANYEQAIALKPGFADGYNNRGAVLGEMQRLEQALSSYDQAIKCNPEHAMAWCNRGITLQELGRSNDAETSLRRALDISPDLGKARWALAICQIPVIQASIQDVAITRARFSSELDALLEWVDGARTKELWKVVGGNQPFYLAYQEEDNKTLLSRYGSLCAGLMESWRVRQNFKKCPPPAAGRIKIGIVSNHVYAHSVWNALVKGLLMHLDPARFEVCVFYLGGKSDSQTALAISLSPIFVQGSRSLSGWVESILENQVEVMIYPEIGMDEMTVKLASMRLAPLQLAMWGHPETTGLPTMDAFVSAEGFEPENSDQFYAEQLVMLPNLGCCYLGFDDAAIGPEVVGRRPDGDVPLLLCPGVSFKYAPQYDLILAEVVRRLGKCRLVFFTNRGSEAITEIFKKRMQKAFKDSSLDFDEYGEFMGWLDMPKFYGLMRQADVYLDTIGFSGFNTAMQAVECGLPIVTREGRFLRGRLASGILKRMGLAELVASDESGYVELVVKLAQDRNYSQEVRRRIENSRHLLFGDTEPIRALEKYLVSHCRREGMNRD